MTSPITIRRAQPDELDWINQRYAEVDFVASGMDDCIAIAEVDGERAGLGRLVPVEDRCAELGGMLVFDAFQGRGIARHLIAWLVRQEPFDELYCLPFAELEGMYASMGFARVDSAPAPVARKHRWCNSFYPKPVLLMRRYSDAAQR